MALTWTLQISANHTVEAAGWTTVAALQPGNDGDDAITPDNFAEGEEDTVFAFEDRNTLSQEWPGRRVFVVLGADCIYLFNSEGDIINEPESYVVDGRQPLDGEEGYADWRAGYYCVLDEVPVVEAAAAFEVAAEPDEAAALLLGMHQEGAAAADAAPAEAAPLTAIAALPASRAAVARSPRAAAARALRAARTRDPRRCWLLAAGCWLLQRAFAAARATAARSASLYVV